MNISINDSGTWRTIKAVFVNDVGTWRRLKAAFVNDSGTWRQVLSSIYLVTTGTAASSGPYTGYGHGSVGSIANGTTVDGKTIEDVGDTTALNFCQLIVSGFTSDPGQNGWAPSVTFSSLGGPVTKLMSAATSYSYTGGQAGWSWSAQAFGAFNGVPFSLQIGA